MCAELVYANMVPKWTVSAETFGNGDGDIVKVCIFDIKNKVSEHLVLQRKQNSMYTVLDSLSADQLASEDRFHLFKTSYGVDDAAIDFSTFKFRRAAASVKGRVLCCRIVQQVRVVRIKPSILNRSDFDDFIRTKARDIHAPTQLNYATVSLYGVPIASNMLGTIKPDKLLNLDSAAQTGSFSTVKIEISLQTEFESISIEDTKDYSLLLRRNNKSVDNLSRDLKNTVKGFKIVQQHRDTYVLSTRDTDNLGANLLMNDSKSDLESWNGSIDSFDSNSDRQTRDAKPDSHRVVLHPSELLKTGYPEIQK